MTAATPFPHGISIRRAGPDDVPALLRLQLSMAFELVGTFPTGREPAYRRELAAYLDKAIRLGSDRAFLAGPTDAEPIATATLRIVHRAPYPRSSLAGECQVGEVYTEPAWRRRGIAAALVEACVEDARALGLRRVCLRTSPAARSIYERLGFTDPGYMLQLDLG